MVKDCTSGSMGVVIPVPNKLDLTELKGGKGT